MQFRDTSEVEVKKRCLRQRLREMSGETATRTDGDAEEAAGGHQKRTPAETEDADVQRLLDGINAWLVARHPRRALLKEYAYKVR